MTPNRILLGLLSLIVSLNVLMVLFFMRYTRFDVNLTPLRYVPHGFKISHPDHVIVFLHIQKTGGSFLEDELVTNIVNHSCPGEKIYSRTKSKFVWRHHRCYKPGSVQNWIFTRRTVGWPCGVHADYTTLNLCARKYLGPGDWDVFFITLLRDPVDRFISEFLHVKRGANWPVYETDCSNGTKFPRERIAPRCEFFSEDRKHLTIEGFMSCIDNPAFNRMTYMLAGYDVTGCGGSSGLSSEERGTVLLQTAKRHLREFEYFGVLEFLFDSARLFEFTFSVRFAEYPLARDTRREELELTPQQLRSIESVNSLDIQLYRWALGLFRERNLTLHGQS